jgi:hypothetical protein
MTRLIHTLGFVALAGCGQLTTPDVTRFIEPEVILVQGAAPSNAALGTCWAEMANTPVITSVTAQIMTRKREKAVRPATVIDGDLVWFERPCDQEMTPYFVESLQRALKARGFYHREINGEMDSATRFAVRLFQQPLGLDSSILSMSGARALGLSRVQLEDGEQAQMAQFHQKEGAVFIPDTEVLEPERPRPVSRP